MINIIPQSLVNRGYRSRLFFPIFWLLYPPKIQSVVWRCKNIILSDKPWLTTPITSSHFDQRTRSFLPAFAFAACVHFFPDPYQIVRGLPLVWHFFHHPSIMRLFRAFLYVRCGVHMYETSKRCPWWNRCTFYNRSVSRRKNRGWCFSHRDWR